MSQNMSHSSTTVQWSTKISMEKENPMINSILLLKYQCAYISAYQKDDLICPVLILLKTMDERVMTSCKGCFKMMGGTLTSIITVLLQFNGIVTTNL